MIQVAHFVFAVLLNSLWEAPLIAFLAWLCLRAAGRPTASTRYVVWVIALLAAALLPAATANVQFAPRRTSTAAFHASVPPATHAVRAAASRNDRARVEAMPQTGLVRGPRVTLQANLALAVAAIWALLAMTFLIRLAVEIWQLEGFKRDALPLPFAYRNALERWADAAGYAHDVRLCVSPHTDVPVAIGLFDAMILLPEWLLAQLSPLEIEHIALHELAHLRRHDDWFNALERIFVTVYFFNPAIRWIAAQMDVEREVACDDHVVDLTREVRPYAHCLTKMAEVTQWPRTALAAPGVFITRKSMSIRIERLLRAGSSQRVRISYGTALAAMATVIAVFAGARFYGPVIAAPLNDVSPPQHAAIRHKAVSVHHAPVARIAEPRVTVRPTAAPLIVAIQTPAPRVVKHTPRPPKHASTTFDARIPRCDGCNLSGINWRGRDLRGIVLHGANLSGADLRDADLRGADLAGSNLDGAQLQGARLDGARLAGLNVTTAGMDITTLRTLLNACAGCNFGTFDGRGKDLSGLHLSGLNLANADLRNADLRNTRFDGVNLNGVRLGGAQLDGAQFNGCNFSGVDLRGVDTSGVKITGSDMSGAILQ